MGVILDSSVLIVGERRKENVGEMLKSVRAAHGDVDCALSVVTIVELARGSYGAKKRRRPRVAASLLRAGHFAITNIGGAKNHWPGRCRH